MAITRLSGGLTPANGSDPRTFPAIFNGAADDIEALQANGSVVTDRIADGAVTAPKLATTAGAVMVFDDAAARTTAIPSPVEGMVTYRSDDDEVEVYDGSQFRRVGGLVDVKSVLKTDTFSASLAASGNVAVTNLSITHTMQNASNRLIIMAYFGVAANDAGRGQVGIAVADNGTLIGIGDVAGDRTRVGAGGTTAGAIGTFVGTMPSVHLVYSPGDTSSHTYTVRAINARADTRTLFINRAEGDSDNGSFTRAVSAITIQEVAG